MTVCQKVPKLYFQSQFWMSKINPIFSRKDFGLDQRIAKEGNVKAQVQSWTSGVDLLSLLKL